MVNKQSQKNCAEEKCNVRGKNVEIIRFPFLSEIDKQLTDLYQKRQSLPSK